eukprot:maker-scaffold_17-snap-gene-6.68-mRNA-1 protein AED:0.02 eAED:0.02 QI:132/0.75/0.8/1/1/1/5/166/588
MSLKPLLQDKYIQAVFVGGKGGVGKTTTSCAIALQFAEARKDSNVLLISTDPAHNISDALSLQLSGEPMLVKGSKNKNLFACEVDPTFSIQSELDQFTDRENDDTVGSDFDLLYKDIRNFVENMPGIDEAMALSSVLDHLRKDKDSDDVNNCYAMESSGLVFSTIIFDTAPTGHTLRLLQLPTLLKAGLEKVQSWKTKLGGLISSVAGYFSGSNTSGSSPADKIKLLEQKLQGWLSDMTFLSELFRDQLKTQFVCICNASFLSVSETLRLLSELKEAGIKSEYVIVNMLMPALFSLIDSNEKQQGGVKFIHNVLKSQGLSQEICDAVKDSVILSGGMAKMQQHYIKKLETDLPEETSLVLLPMLKQEIRGMESLYAFSNYLLETDPKLLVSDADRAKVEQFGKFNGIQDDGYTANVESKFFKKLKENETAEEEDEVAEMEVDEFQIGDWVELSDLSSRPELNAQKGVVKSKEADSRYGILIDGWDKKLSIRSVNLTKIEKEKSEGIENVNMDNVTPEMIALVQKVLMKPGGLDELLSHDLVKEMKQGNDEEMKSFFKDIETNGMFAGIRYLSNKYVMGKLANVAKQIA